MERIIRILLGCGALLIIAALACAGVVFFVSEGNPVRYVQSSLLRFQLAGREDDLKRAISTDETTVRFAIESGDTPRIIAQNLIAANLIADAELFVQYVRVEGLDTGLEAGTYFLTRAQTLREIAQTLTDSRSGQFAFRILEGWRMEEVAESIDENGFFSFTGADFLRVVNAGAVVDPVFRDYVGLPLNASLEGFLFPNTYQLPAQITAEGLRDSLLIEFTTQVTPALREAAIAQDLSLFEIVTLASIIQREAVHADEHAMIASAYRNRLETGIKLDADPTVQYARGVREGDWWANITQANYYDTVSPYNTYLDTGLPPGPISSPGLSAIEGAIRPAQSAFIFFRADCSGNGYHRFAVTLEEHVANECP